MTRTYRFRGVAWGLLLAATLAAAGQAQAPKTPANPYVRSQPQTPESPLDVRMKRSLRAHGLKPAPACSDGVFIRRIYLDVLGALPEPQAVRTFLADKRTGKRARLIDDLLQREAFADYWALKWCDVLRVKAEFPINLWPNAVQAYHRWVRDALSENLSYDRFARALLTSSGSNFRVPPVNFYRAVQGHDPETLAAAAVLTFMGVRFEAWPEERRQGVAGLFSRVAFKGTAEWKEEIVYLDPAATEPLRALLPDWTPVTVAPGQDPRQVFADWLITAENPWFAPNAVNRVWAWLFGRGLVDEADDFRDDNPPVHPEVLSYLAQELARTDWDLRHVYRLILNSQTYQQSCVPQGPDSEQAARLFACYPVRRLDAEVLIDALGWISGTRESYSSAIPEPFTFIPEDQRTVELADGSITSQFLEMFGRPPRDTGRLAERNNRPSQAQLLYLLNSSQVQQRIERSWRLASAARTAKGKRRVLVNQLYLTMLSRLPTEAEFQRAEAYATSKGVSSRQALQDLAWALINTKEFLYRH